MSTSLPLPRTKHTNYYESYYLFSAFVLGAEEAVGALVVLAYKEVRVPCHLVLKVGDFRVPEVEPLVLHDVSDDLIGHEEKDPPVLAKGGHEEVVVFHPDAHGTTGLADAHHLLDHLFLAQRIKEIDQIIAELLKLFFSLLGFYEWDDKGILSYDVGEGVVFKVQRHCNVPL